MKLDLLVEIGTEELPARFVDGALGQMQEAAEKQLADLRLTYDRLEVKGTPRRLALLVFGLAARQEDLVREMKGPSARVAFDETGAPTKAALGFARGQGVSVDELEIRETEQGRYVFAITRFAGRPAADVLAEWLPGFIAGLQFPKSMRWGDGTLRFARPVRWLVALLDGQVLPVTLDGVAAGRISRGHRFLAKGDVVLDGPADYVERMRAAYVLVDGPERTQAVRDEVRRAAEAHGASVLEDEDLVAEVANLVEWPAAVVGSFDESFLQLPRAALITPMREHQRYFPLADKAGRLLPLFVAVANGPREDMDVVRRGNEKVLAARLADARFFYDEDRKTPLADYVPRLKDVVFQGGWARCTKRWSGCGPWRRPWPAWPARTKRSRPWSTGPPTWPKPTWSRRWCTNSPSCRASWAGNTRCCRAKGKRWPTRCSSITCPGSRATSCRGHWRARF